MLSWIDYPAPAAAVERVLLLMLPAAGAQAEEFAAQGFVVAAQSSGLAIDIVAVQPPLDLYFDGGIAAALHRQIVEPAQKKGYRRIWLLGISLGGMGALLYAAAHEPAVEGVILLAPFLGTKGTIAALAATGGILGAGDPGIATAPEQKLLAWLRDYAATGRQVPKLYLGYGSDDRFAPGHKMLAEMLPPARVAMLPGGHDWACWQALWRELLVMAPFDA